MLKIKLKIIGIHCKSCKELIENEISVLSGVRKVYVDEKTYKAEIEYNPKLTSTHEIVKEIENLNYEVRVVSSAHSAVSSHGQEDAEKKKTIGGPNRNGKYNLPLRNFLIGGILLLIIGLAYFTISKYGAFSLLGKLNEPNLGYPLIFAIGLLTSFHCIGMCGGIVMAYTSRFCASVKGNKNISMPHISYNLGRIISYTLTGAVLGGIGSFFAINKTFIALITLLAGLFMVAVGLSLLSKISVLEKITGILPLSFARLFSKQLHTAKPKAPFIIGFLNGFIPCGPLQALQIYALASGSALAGGLSMAVFGLGTAPLMLGFGNIISIFSKSRLKQVMKVSGAIVILLGLLTLNRAWSSINWNSDNQIPSVQENIPQKPDSSVKNNEQSDNYQIARMDLVNRGYVPSVLTVKSGVPVKWVINAKEISGCTDEIMLPAFGIDRKLKPGENIIEFTPKVPGTYKFSCGMQMVWGKFVVE